MILIRSLIVALFLSSLANAQVNVVTTIPDLKNLVEEIGGEHVSVKSLARGLENVHRVQLKPSHLVAVSRADAFVQIGLSLEHAFVPSLLRKAGNNRLRPGKPGFVNCSEGWDPIQVGLTSSRGLAADTHPDGNPHINLDPRAGRIFAEKILNCLVAIDTQHEDYYRERHKKFSEALAKAEERWAKLAKKLAGTKLCVYHRDFDYLTSSLGIEIVGTIEPNPGVPPTPSDLARAVKLIREQEVKVVLTARWSNNNSTRFVAEKAGARVIEMPAMVTSGKGTDTWIGMMEHLHTVLEEALAPEDDAK